MNGYIIAYDLGTSGNKASLYDMSGKYIADSFVSYPTYYPKSGWHEQRPEDWWNAVIKSTHLLLEKTSIKPEKIIGCGISGHSLGVVPVDAQGRLLRESVPIWSDSRAVKEAAEFFTRIDETSWYMTTGNGFPPPLYTIFKLMWLKNNESELFSKIYKVLGTKDYINFRMTGEICTDHSYASGSGIYSLANWVYDESLIEASGITIKIFPDIVKSTAVIGTVSHEAASILGLPETVKVVAGGVDNSCMALGSRNIVKGRIYNSLGSSSWIAVCSDKPLLEPKYRPYVFAHVIPGLYNSALAIFSAGSSFRWVRDNLCANILTEAEKVGKDAYDLMTHIAASVLPGSEGLLFNPNLAGGSYIDKSPNVRGAFIGLGLRHTQSHIIRAAMEGVAMQLGLALNLLNNIMIIGDEILLSGGGSKSSLWRQIFADVYNKKIMRCKLDQQVATLGAAALAAVGCDLWENFEKIDTINPIVEVTSPNKQNVEIYARNIPVFADATNCLADISTRINGIIKGNDR